MTAPPARTITRDALLMWSAAASCVLGFSSALLWLTPPSYGPAGVAFAVSCLASTLLWLRCALSASARRVLARWWVALTGAMCLATVAAVDVLAPLIGLELALLALVWLPAAATSVIAGVVSLHRRPFPSLVALSAVALAVAIMVADTGDVRRAGLRVRVELVAARWVVDAKNALRAAPGSDLHDGRPFVAVETGGRHRVVVWSLVDGIPFRSWGLVYSPDVPSSVGPYRTTDGVTITLDDGACEQVIEHWSYCRVH